MTGALLKVENLVVAYRSGSKSTRPAVCGVNLEIEQGETLGLVGESGCGKTSLARAIMQLVKPVRGRVLLGKEDLTKLDRTRLRQLRPKFQMIFQDAVAALNPRRTIGASIAMPLELLGIASRADRLSRACRMLEDVGLDPALYDLLPYQLSGGQCQRVQIARALICNPELLICDEPVSALDVSVRSQIINLLERMRSQINLTMLFISHDLSVVKHFCDRTAVMYAGKLCEVAHGASLYKAPLHPYTRALLAATPQIGKFKADHQFDMHAVAWPELDPCDHGCQYRVRCGRAKERCRDDGPALRQTGPDGYVACHYPYV